MRPDEILFKLSIYILARGRSAERGEVKTTAMSQREDKILNQGMAMAYLDVQDFLKANGVRISAKN